jgi:hypothetical protein
LMEVYVQPPTHPLERLVRRAVGTVAKGPWLKVRFKDG